MDDRPKRCYIPKEGALSPAISFDSLFVSLIIDTQEGRDVAMFDVPGVFVNTDTTR